eukprot:CAMPEP_0179230178 /NCGR_PEP_ID=MMETSP0797-20121207/10706_1 /TAXON_ID=47934 /ORGANISM="Dinophysis acuminata, Strain DAEP01" /LENGTH=387 /DNA_ID=CAMNT_0020937251 /DNA_START=40 /DNA_END=1204 /DNA_ORIENTATION=-
MGSQQTGAPLRRLLLAGVCAAAVPLVIFVAGLPATADVSVARAGHRRLTSTVVAAEDDSEELMKEVLDEKLKLQVAESAAKGAAQKASAEAAKATAAVSQLKETQTKLAQTNKQLQDALDSIAKKQGSLEQAESATATAQKALAEARESSSSALRQANEQIALLQGALRSGGMGPLGVWLQAQDGKALPAVLGVVGACAVLGPAAFVRLFLAVVGSGVAGLMVASCYVFFHAGEKASWVGTVLSVFTGSGPLYSYAIWAIFALVGVLRWWFGTEVILPGRYHPDDMPESAIDTRPLLAAGKEANGNSYQVRSRSALPNIPPPPAVPNVKVAPKVQKQETPSVPAPPRPPSSRTASVLWAIAAGTAAPGSANAEAAAALDQQTLRRTP